MTLIEPPSVTAMQTEASTVRNLNQYRCPYCQIDWEDVWDCVCNDRCPDCNKEIEPYESSLIDCEAAENG